VLLMRLAWAYGEGGVACSGPCCGICCQAWLAVALLGASCKALLGALLLRTPWVQQQHSGGCSGCPLPSLHQGQQLHLVDPVVVVYAPMLSAVRGVALQLASGFCDAVETVAPNFCARTCGRVPCRRRPARSPSPAARPRSQCTDVPPPGTRFTCVQQVWTEATRPGRCSIARCRDTAMTQPGATRWCRWCGSGRDGGMLCQ
jgi:hypothetical protein